MKKVMFICVQIKWENECDIIFTTGLTNQNSLALVADENETSIGRNQTENK
mgnify:CR=1 FL=1